MDNLDDKRLRVQITEQELLCKNRCGFYGTPQWNGLCSTCWRVYQLEVKRANDYNKNRSLLGNEKQEEKKIDGKGKIRSILSKSPSIMFSNAELTTSTTHSSSASPLTSRSRSPPENEAIQSPFQKYLYETFSSVVAKDIDKNCKHLIHRLFHGDNLSMDELSEIVQAFYQEMKDRLLRIKSLPKEFNMSHFMNELEKYICTEAYSALFFSRSDDEAADLSLQDRIRSLHWVTSGFLETALDFSIPKVQDFIDEAVTEIIDINSHMAVEDKLAKLVICSKKIFEALKESRSGAPASADEFLPSLIYIILKANPPLILSNLKFISRFALPSRVIRGESGYYFTNLSCALQFIQDMNAESLRMRKDEFEAYTTGKQMAPLVNRDCMSNLAIRSMENSLKQLQLLREDQMKIKHRMQELEKRINEDAEEFKLNVQRFLDSYPSEKVRQICQSLKDEPEEWRFLS